MVVAMEVGRSSPILNGCLLECVLTSVLVLKFNSDPSHPELAQTPQFPTRLPQLQMPTTSGVLKLTHF